MTWSNTNASSPEIGVTLPVDTVSGAVRGLRRGRALSFFGLRYGATTACRNRFRPPLPPEPWTGVADALHPGPSAPQLPRPENTDPYFSWYSATGPTDEDCLFLNLHTPATDAAKRPVMVWIHGGGWREFSGNAPGFDGHRLAAAEEVVVISLNHRLGVFGFLSLVGEGEGFADSGNVGILDLVHALAWIRENVSAFGGDPENVTLFGQSGGASKIVALASMPAARGLFHKAIVQSSGNGLDLATAEEAAESVKLIKAALGRGNISAQELQTVPTDDLLVAASKVPVKLRGIIDGRNIFADPLVPQGHGAAPSAGIPMMLGTTATEAAYYFANQSGIGDIDMDTCRHKLSRYLGVPERLGAEITSLYASSQPTLTPAAILMRGMTDLKFFRTNLILALRQAVHAPRQVYLYRFDHPSALGPDIGAPHTSEIPYILGTLETAEGMIGRSPQHTAISRLMMRTWASFARTGHPGHADLPAWSTLDAGGLPYMVLQREPRVEMLEGSFLRAALELVSPLVPVPTEG